MKKITKPANLIEFNDKIVVLTPKSSYYGNAYEHKITKKGLVFACISQDSINHSKTVEKITNNETISRIDIDLFGTCHRVRPITARRKRLFRNETCFCKRDSPITKVSTR